MTLWERLTRRRRGDADLQDEIRAHLAMAAQERVDAGDDRETARLGALKEFGNVTLTAEESRYLRRGRVLEYATGLAQDLRYARRMLARAPGFTVVAVLSLAIGIGANAAVFSFADALLLRPLAIPRASGLLTVGSTSTSLRAVLHASYPDYVDLRDRTQTFESVTAFTESVAGVAGESGTAPVLTMGMLVSANFFATVGVEPDLGRTFRPDEDQVAGRDAVVVLGHTFWQRAFEGDPTVLGRTIRLNDTPFTVIGVAPAGFTGLDQYARSDFYAPLMMWPALTAAPTATAFEARDLRSLNVRGRLKPGVAMAAAQAELSAIAADLERAYPDTNRQQRLVVRTELQARIAAAPPIARLLLMLSVLSAAVLFVACANVAGLLTSRAPVRAREIAMRLAIGAGRARIVRQLITESVLLALFGGIAGIGVGYAGVRLFRLVQIPTDLPIVALFEMDRRALGVSLLAAVVSAIFFGLAPAIRSTRTDLMAVMKATDAAGVGRRRWGRAALVVAQVSASVVLLVTATFFYRGFRQQLGGGPGFPTDHLLMMSVAPGQPRYTPAQSQRFFEQLAAQARLVPGVTSAGLTRYMPMDGLPPSLTLVPEGVQLPAGKESATHARSIVDEGFFETIGLPIVAGRGFRATDVADAPKVAVVNEVFARRYWPGRDPIGKRFRLDSARGPWVEIVGVTRTIKYGFIIEKPIEFVYLPYTQRQPESMFLLVRTAGDPAALAAPLRDLVHTLDANLPITNVRTMDELYRLRSVTILNVIVTLVGAMGLMGLALAIVGLYGLVAYAASRRTKEIGIRMAIGARRGDVLRLVLGQGLVLAVAGLGVGLAASAGISGALTRIFPGGVGGDGRADYGAFLWVAMVVLAVTLAAAYIPAQRASRVNPTDALRCE